MFKQDLSKQGLIGWAAPRVLSRLSGKLLCAVKTCQIFTFAAFLALFLSFSASSSFAADSNYDRPSPWGVAVYGGWSSDSNFSGIFITPWKTEFENTQLLAGAISKRVYDLNKYFFVELEAGVGKRFTNDNATEFWGAIYLRFDGLPWNDIVYITIGLNTGLNFASHVSTLEQNRSDESNNEGSKLLHFLSPEITFAHPDNKDVELLFRLHHRSGVFGLFNGVFSGSHFLTTGIRFRF